MTETVKLKLPEEVLEDSEERRVVERYTPLGVIAGILPWNYPLHTGNPPFRFDCVIY
jgi:acyl-CoA reductase-like NAD-dependent aldehyde dehydrogenase